MSIKSENIYDILGIDRNANAKAIKKAYAELVKQYHPEDNPEEWKRIHDAYDLAMAIASGQKQKVSVPVMPESQEQEFELTELVKTPKNDLENLFGEIEKIANMQHEEEEKAMESALDAIRQLACNKESKKTEWKEFFEQENLLPIISQKKFLRELGGCFAHNQIDLSLYFYLNKQIGLIAEYIEEHNADMTRSQDLTAVRYAKEKVRLAHKHYEEEQREKRRAKWDVPLFLFFFLLFIITFLVIMANL